MQRKSPCIQLTACVRVLLALHVQQITSRLRFISIRLTYGAFMLWSRAAAAASFSDHELCPTSFSSQARKESGAFNSAFDN